MKKSKATKSNKEQAREWGLPLQAGEQGLDSPGTTPLRWLRIGELKDSVITHVSFNLGCPIDDVVIGEHVAVDHPSLHENKQREGMLVTTKCAGKKDGNDAATFDVIAFHTNDPGAPSASSRSCRS